MNWRELMRQKAEGSARYTQNTQNPQKGGESQKRNRPSGGFVDIVDGLPTLQKVIELPVVEHQARGFHAKPHRPRRLAAT